jgi:aspartate/methionine/tyrosine aminotransferase
MPDLREIEKTNLSKVKVMWTNYPHMPTGTKGSVKLYEELVAFGLKHGILICNDNPYSFILNTEYLSILAVEGAKEIALELNSLSKSHNMAGWRIGILAGSRDYIGTVLKVKSNMDSGMFRAMQEAAAEALNNPPSWYEKVNNVYRKRRIIVEEIMDLLKCSFDKNQTGLFVWGKIPDQIRSCEEFVEDILQRTHVFITPGFIFGSNGERFVRISLCADKETLIKAKERILEKIASSSRP